MQKLLTLKFHGELLSPSERCQVSMATQVYYCKRRHTNLYTKSQAVHL
jgi:hypothetical protein